MTFKIMNDAIDRYVQLICYRVIWKIKQPVLNDDISLKPALFRWLYDRYLMLNEALIPVAHAIN